MLYAFKGGSDGSNPFAGVTFDSKGALYGTTQAGGGAASCAPRGCGAAFKLAPPTPPATKWTESVLYRFQGVAGGDGEAPEGGLVFNKSGALFGTTSAGGKIGLGTAFQLTPPAPGHSQWTETVLSDLPSGGANPIGDPLLCPLKGGQPARAPAPGGPISSAAAAANCAEIFAALDDPIGNKPLGGVITLLFALLACAPL